MKTARLLSLLMVLGALAQKVAADGNHSGQGEKENQTHGKTEAPVAGPSGEKQEGPKASPQASGHPVNKTDEKRAPTESTKAREANARQPVAASHGSMTSRASGLPSGPKAAGNLPNKVTPGNTITQHQAGLSKPASAANNGTMAKKTENTSTRPVALSANKLPTSPSVNTGRGRVPGLATIGGPAKPGAGNTAAISGTSIKYRP